MTTWIICAIIGVSLLVLGTAVVALRRSLRAFQDVRRTLAIRMAPAGEISSAVRAIRARLAQMEPRLAETGAHASDLQTRRTHRVAG